MKPLNILLYSSIFFFIGIAFSCNKEKLDRRTNQNLIIPTSLNDFEALLDNSLVMNQTSLSISEVGTDSHYATTGTYQQLMSSNERNAYSWSHNSPYLTVLDWNNSYQRILYCNLVLDGIEKNKPQTSADIQQFNSIKGNALFHRAKNFWDLAQVWAPVYLVSNASTTLGIPLRLSSDINIKSTRPTLQETYDQIISDLLKAKDLLPITPKFKTRGSKVSAFALLARAYLSMSKFSEAKQYADSCLSLYNTLMDYNSISSANAQPFAIFNSEVLFHSTSNSNISLISNYYAAVDSSFYNSYNDKDLRKSLFFTSGVDAIYFRGSYTNDGYSPFVGLAIDEQYLIRAECDARAGDITSAMNDLNTLMLKRWKNDGSFVPFTASTPADALDKVLIERKKELFLRGVRWSDLKRLNKDPQLAVTITRKVLGQQLTLAPNSFQYTLPIPDDIIKQSSLQQNIGW